MNVDSTPRLKEGLEKAARELPDLILMDIQLPDGNGLEAMETLQQDPKTAEIPVIALSGLDPKYYRPRALAAGCRDFISKPFKVYDLAQSLLRWLPSQPRC